MCSGVNATKIRSYKMRCLLPGTFIVRDTQTVLKTYISGANTVIIRFSSLGPHFNSRRRLLNFIKFIFYKNTANLLKSETHCLVLHVDINIFLILTTLVILFALSSLKLDINGEYYCKDYNSKIFIAHYSSTYLYEP